MEKIIDNSAANRVHSHVEIFDGTTSPPGFAAVVLLDESHFTAHCYSSKGWLSIDCHVWCNRHPFNHRRNGQGISSISPTMKLEKKKVESRFTTWLMIE